MQALFDIESRRDATIDSALMAGDRVPRHVISDYFEALFKSVMVRRERELSDITLPYELRL